MSHETPTTEAKPENEHELSIGAPLDDALLEHHAQTIATHFVAQAQAKALTCFVHISNAAGLNDEKLEALHARIHVLMAPTFVEGLGSYYLTVRGTMLRASPKGIASAQGKTLSRRAADPTDDVYMDCHFTYPA